MTSEALSGIAGAALALLFEYAPGFKTWFAKFDAQQKSLTMLILLVVVTAGALALSCYGPFDWYECTQSGIWEAVFALVVAITANQGVHRLTKSKK